jgi:phospholipid/cholesterol/gamma-HCH transport system ATP-binding protein
MLPHILPIIPKHDIYTEVFFGGGAVYWAKQPAKNETINDRLDYVINFYTQLKTNFSQLSKLIQGSLVSRSMHSKALLILKNGALFSELSKDQKKELRNSIGMLFQGNALFDSMTVEENVKFPLDMFSGLTEIEKLAKVNKILARVQLTGVNEKYPAEISGGMKKRVALARALVLEPKYLFCDEPNSGLDPQTSLVIDKLIEDLTKEFNITTLVVTHDMNSVMEIGKYIIYLHKGKKEWEGSNQDIIFSQNKLLNDFIFASEFLQDAKAMRMMAQNK